MSTNKHRGATFALTASADGKYELRAWWQEWEEGYGWCDHRSFISQINECDLPEVRKQLTAKGYEEV